MIFAVDDKVSDRRAAALDASSFLRRWSLTARSDAAATAEKCLFALAVLGIAWVPFWLGSNRDIAWLINAAYFGALVMALEAALLLTGTPHPVALRKVAVPALLYAVTCLWILIQCSTAVPSWLEHPLYQYSRDTLTVEIPGSISINRDLTAMALLRLMTAGAVFWLFLQLCRPPQRALWTVQAVAVIGIAYGVYGIVAYFVFPGTILWLPKHAYLDSVTSTFINRNSYATYAGIGLVAVLACAINAYTRNAALAGRSALRRLVAFAASTAGAAGLWIAGAFILGLALVRTGSRGGILASLIGLVALVLMIALRGRNAVAAMASLAGLLAAGAAVFVFGDVLAGRLLAFGFEASDRLAVYKLTVLSILDSPLKGFGYGTFAYVFPMYRDNSLSSYGFWDKAHNTYLEVVQGLGIPVALLVLAVFVILVARCARAVLSRRNSATAPLVAVSATVIVGLHAFVDFSLQIQAVALTWTALLAAGVAQSWRSEVDTAA